MPESVPGVDVILNRLRERRLRFGDYTYVHTEDAESAVREARDATIREIVELLGGYDGPLYLAAPNQGEQPDYYAAVVLLRKIVTDLAARRFPNGGGE